MSMGSIKVLARNEGARAFARGLRDAFILGALLVGAYFADQILDQVNPQAATAHAEMVATSHP